MPEQLIVLALLVAAFAAGWVARGAGAGSRGTIQEPEEEAALLSEEAEPRPEPEPEPEPQPQPDPAQLRAAADSGAGHLAAAIDAWLDDHGDGSAAGRQAIAGLDGALDALSNAPDGPAAEAAEALGEARRALAAYGTGTPLDAATSRRLDAQEEALERARARLAA